MTETAEEVAIVTATGGASRVAAHAGITFAGLMAANVLNYVFYTLVSRSLGVEAYGAFSSLVAVVLILQAPALVAQTVVAKLATDMAGDPNRLAGLVRGVERVTIVVALATGAMLAAFSIPLAHFLHVDDPWLVTLAAASICGALALPFLRGVLQGTSAFSAFSLSNVVEGLAKAVFAPVLGLAGGIRGAMGGFAVGLAVAASYTFVAALPHRRGIPVHLSLRVVARSSAPVALAVVGITVLLLFDVVLAKRYLDAYAAGLYGAAALASRALFAIVAFVPTVLLPQTAQRVANRERTRGLFGQAIGLAALLCAGAIVLFGLFPRLVITTIAGRSFASGAGLLVPYVYAIAMLSLANVTAMYNIARSRMTFVVPLLAVVCGEVATIIIRHASSTEFLQTIAIGHTLAFLAAATALGGSTQATRSERSSGPATRARRGATGDVPRRTKG